MRNRISTILGVIALILGALTLVGATAAQATSNGNNQGDDHKVTLCHRTNSVTNPYVEITIDKDAVFRQGHDGHDGPVYTRQLKADDTKWGDIIPAFDYTVTTGHGKDKTTVTEHYDGKNLTSEGVVILENGCQVSGDVGQTTPTPTPSTSTPQPSQTVTTPVPSVSPTTSTPQPTVSTGTPAPSTSPSKPTGKPTTGKPVYPPSNSPSLTPPPTHHSGPPAGPSNTPLQPTSLAHTGGNSATLTLFGVGLLLVGTGFVLTVTGRSKRRHA